MKNIFILLAIVSLQTSLWAPFASAQPKTMSCCSTHICLGASLSCCKPDGQKTTPFPASTIESNTSKLPVILAAGTRLTDSVQTIFVSNLLERSHLSHAPPLFLIKSSFLI